MSITGVAVEKVGFSEKNQKSGGRKCPGDSEKSFIELSDAKQFLRNRSWASFPTGTGVITGYLEMRELVRMIS
jgi:hypothetical protein